MIGAYELKEIKQPPSTQLGQKIKGVREVKFQYG